MLALLALGCPAAPTDTAEPLACRAGPGLVQLDGVLVDDLNTALALSNPWSNICLGEGEHVVLEDHATVRHELLPGRMVIRGVGPQTRMTGDPELVPTLENDDFLLVEDLYLSDVALQGGIVLDRVEAGRFIGFSTSGWASDFTAREVIVTGRWVFQDAVIADVLRTVEFAEIQGLTMEGSGAPSAVEVSGQTTLREMRFERNSGAAIGIEEGGALMLVDATFEENSCDVAVRDGQAWVCVRDDLGYVDELRCDWEGTCS